ncbi:MAG TPA: hypothetical protein VLA23_12275 [Candidatus Limnocylindrales bacterium]|nr:hypothetical protein [Candidatus Limnocylindrales bacterium]
MARAKRTDRADARRRHRMEAAARAESGEPIEPPPARSDRTASGPAPTDRPSVVGAFRAAARLADVRADIAFLPSLVIRTKAIWVPSALVIAAGALFLTPDLGQNIVFVLAFQAFVVPPPLAASFLAGLLAPRAAWLAGGVVGLISAGTFAVVAVLYEGSVDAAITADQLRDTVLFGFAVAPLFGIGAGAFAGFYRRFLRFGQPARRANQGRRNSGRR